MQVNYALTDEIKDTYGEENKVQERFPVLKSHSTLFRASLKDIDALDQHNDNSKRSQEQEDTKHIYTPFKSSEQSVFTCKVQCKTIMPSNSDGCIDEISEENILPNIPTEVLHSFAKVC